MKHHGALHSGTDAKLRNNTGKSSRVHPCTPILIRTHARVSVSGAARHDRRGQRLANMGDVTEDFGATEGRATSKGRYVGEKLSGEVSSWVARSNLIQLS